MGAMLVVIGEPPAKTSAQFRAGFEDVQVDAFVFQGPPEPLDEDIVHPASPTIHADLDLGRPQNAGEGVAGELTALIRRSLACQSGRAPPPVPRRKIPHPSCSTAAKPAPCGLGVPLMRAIDKGLVNSRVGIVLVTPAMLRRLPAEGVADKELSALLRRERLVPVVHGTTYEELEQVSMLLASRAGLSTAEEPMAQVATKIAELVAI